MLISIITVTYNCENNLVNTLDSVLMQDFDNYELLVIDGNSSDKTVDIAESYLGKIKNMRVYSEPDKGIYDAMNKGIAKAKGDYLYFLNAGDTFIEETVLENVALKLKSRKSIYYGNILRGDQIEKYPGKLSLNWLILREKMVCHQAIFAKRSLYVKNPYNLEYRICADREWLIKVLKSEVTYEYMKNITVCHYDVNGVSSNYSNFENESLKIARQFGYEKYIVLIKLKRSIGIIFRHSK